MRPDGRRRRRGPAGQSGRRRSRGPRRQRPIPMEPAVHGARTGRRGPRQARGGGGHHPRPDALAGARRRARRRQRGERGRHLHQRAQRPGQVRIGEGREDGRRRFAGAHPGDGPIQRQGLRPGRRRQRPVPRGHTVLVEHAVRGRAPRAPPGARQRRPSPSPGRARGRPPAGAAGRPRGERGRRCSKGRSRRARAGSAHEASTASRGLAGAHPGDGPIQRQGLRPRRRRLVRLGGRRPPHDVTAADSPPAGGAAPAGRRAAAPSPPPRCGRGRRPPRHWTARRRT